MRYQLAVGNSEHISFSFKLLSLVFSVSVVGLYALKQKFSEESLCVD